MKIKLRKGSKKARAGCEMSHALNTAGVSSSDLFYQQVKIKPEWKLSSSFHVFQHTLFLFKIFHFTC